jgi:hypothetical protein
MKSRLFIVGSTICSLLLIIFPINYSIGNDKKVTNKETYYSLINYLNAEITKYHVYSNSKIKLDSNTSKVFNTNDSLHPLAWEKLIDLCTNIIKNTVTINRCKEIYLLRDLFNEDWTKEVARTTLLEKLNGIDSKFYSLLKSSPYIQASINNLFNKWIPPINKEARLAALNDSISSINSRLNLDETKIEKLEKGTGFDVGLFIALIAVLFICFLAAVYFFYKRFQKYFKNIMERSKAEIDAIKWELQRLKQDPSGKSSSQPLNHSLTNPDDISLPQKINDEEELPESARNVFYFSSPTREGKFPKKNASRDFKETVSVYRFEIKGNAKNKAEFYLLDDRATVSRIINNPADYIDPVCDDEGTYFPNATKILRLSNGISELEGDYWVVKRKAHIKYR